MLQTIAGLPAIPGAQLAVPAAAAQPGPAPAATEQMPKLAIEPAEACGRGVPGFFSAAQLAALERLADAVAPAFKGRPSARECGVPGFLDFLVRESPAEIQKLYRDGLDRLAREGVNAETLSPLKQAWTYDGPQDPFARFLAQAKQDILQAMFNSREYSAAMSRGRRGAAGLNYYWRALD